METQANTSDEQKIKFLDTLLLMAPPRELRKSVQSSLFAYILEQDMKAVPPDFKKVVENHYFLIDFLDKVEFIKEPKEQ